MKEYGDVCV